MSEQEEFVWIGPVSADDAAGRTARGHVRGLIASRVRVAVLDTGDGSVASEFEAASAVRATGTTIVRQCELSRVCRTSAILPLRRDARQVAFVIVDCTALDAETAAFLADCDEVWVPNFAQGEFCASLGIERSKTHVIAPGSGTRAEDRRAAVRTPRLLNVGGSMLAVDGFEVAQSVTVPGSLAWQRELAAVDAVCSIQDRDAWGIAALDLATSEKVLACSASGAALEILDESDGTWFAAGDETLAQRALLDVARNFAVHQGLARRSAARVCSVESERSAASAILERGSRSRALSDERLARVLADLGLPTPEERLAGSRARVEIIGISSTEGAWDKTLASRLSRAADDATVVLWIDEALGTDTERITARAEAAIARAGRAAEDLDVLIVTAPLAHAPRERQVEPFNRAG